MISLLQDESKLGRNEDNILETNFLYSLHDVYKNHWGMRFTIAKAREIADQKVGSPLNGPEEIFLGIPPQKEPGWCGFESKKFGEMIMLQKQCPICFEPIMLTKFAYSHNQAQHKHLMHVECRDQYIQYSNSDQMVCPLCRQPCLLTPGFNYPPLLHSAYL